MAKPELGTKRICPETGRKFYDLNRDPIVSPFTGVSYPLSFFEESIAVKVKEKAAEEEDEGEDEVEAEADDIEVVSLEEADDDTSGGPKSGKSSDLPDIDGDDDDDDVEIDDDDDDTFLADDDDDDDDMSDIIGVSDEDEDL